MNVMVSLSHTPMADPPRWNPFLRSSSDAPPFPCITPSTVTCVMVVSFMVAAPFSLGFGRRLIRLDRGADLIGRSRVRPANSTRRIWNTKRIRTATCASVLSPDLTESETGRLVWSVYGAQRAQSVQPAADAPAAKPQEQAKSVAVRLRA